MKQNEINRVAGAGSIWGDLSLRLVIARLAGTTHSHPSRTHLAFHHRDTELHGPQGWLLSRLTKKTTKGLSFPEFFLLLSWQGFQIPCLSRLNIRLGVSNTHVHGDSRLWISEMDSDEVVASWRKHPPSTSQS